jgi:hypothetical protein
MKPYNGAITMALSNIMALFSLLPLIKESPVARVYVAGYASVIYNTLLNSYFAFKEVFRGY